MLLATCCRKPGELSSRSTNRTAVYGPVRTVVWEGSDREVAPYPDYQAMHVVQATGLRRRRKNTGKPTATRLNKAVIEAGSGTLLEFSVPFISLVPKALKPLR